MTNKNGTLYPKHLLLAALATVLASGVWAQELKVHYMNVGQGDGAVLVSPGGEIVLFDAGRKGECDGPLSYLRNLGIDHVDYLIVSHYHADHIGCVQEMLTEFPLRKAAYDRGGSYPSSIYNTYVTTVGSLRATATKSHIITLDSGSPSPVTIQLAALNGNGVQTTNENDLSLVAVVHHGAFDAVIGGDLSGVKSENYEDIETSVAPLVGQVEVYKVHHHCSRYSTNGNWLDLTRPKIGIVSAGNEGNTYGHPTSECLERLHQAGVVTYWTEKGHGAEPDAPRDSVCGDIVVSYAPGATSFTVKCGDEDPVQHSLWGTQAPPTAGQVQWAWSTSSPGKKYHYAQCAYVRRIKPENLRRSDTPPSAYSLHGGCPTASGSN